METWPLSFYLNPYEIRVIYTPYNERKVYIMTIIYTAIAILVVAGLNVVEKDEKADVRARLEAYGPGEVI